MCVRGHIFNNSDLLSKVCPFQNMCPWTFIFTIYLIILKDFVYSRTYFKWLWSNYRIMLSLVWHFGISTIWSLNFFLCYRTHGVSTACGSKINVILTELVYQVKCSFLHIMTNKGLDFSVSLPHLENLKVFSR